MALNRLWVTIGSRISPRMRRTLLITLLIVLVLAVTLVPQVSVWACIGSGSCPCPGCG